MKIRTATAIFKQIDSDKFTDDDKAIAIHEVMNMPTHNGVTKEEILTALKWPWNYFLEITEW